MLTLNRELYENTLARETYQFNLTVRDEIDKDNVFIHEEFIYECVDIYSKFLRKRLKLNTSDEKIIEIAEDHIETMLTCKAYNSVIITYDNGEVIWRSILNGNDYLSIIASSIEINTFFSEVGHIMDDDPKQQFEVLMCNDYLLVKRESDSPYPVENACMKSFPLFKQNFGFLFSEGYPGIAIEDNFIKMDGVFVILRSEYKEKYDLGEAISETVYPFLAIIREQSWNQKKPILNFKLAEGE